MLTRLYIDISTSQIRKHVGTRQLDTAPAVHVYNDWSWPIMSLTKLLLAGNCRPRCFH